MKSKVKTPELEKIRANRQESQSIGNFLDWLHSEQELHICAYDGECEEGFGPDNWHGIYTEERDSIEKLLARYFDIDLNKVESERQALLDELRRNNEG